MFSHQFKVILLKVDLFHFLETNAEVAVSVRYQLRISKICECIHLTHIKCLIQLGDASIGSVARSAATLKRIDVKLVDIFSKKVARSAFIVITVARACSLNIL